MKITRRETRISAIKILYIIDFNKCDIMDAYNQAFFDEIKNEESLEFVCRVTNNLEKIDSIISESLENYTMLRLNIVDKAILRLATLELLEGISPNICINEALEITKIYSDLGDKASVRFNNRLLDKIKTKIMGE